MKKCPGCNATLPDMATGCQFCGASFAPPVPAGRGAGRLGGIVDYTGGRPSWVLPAYYGIAAWWVLSGLREVVSSTVVAHGEIGILTLLIGGATALVGLGLLLRVEAVRGIVNVLCFIQILDGAMSLVIGVFMTGILGVWGAIGMIFSALQIALACLMIFLIGETDTKGPDF